MMTIQNEMFLVIRSRFLYLLPLGRPFPGRSSSFNREYVTAKYLVETA